MSAKRSLVTTGAAIVLGVVLFLAVFGPWVSPSDPDTGELRDALSAPSSEHWLGTDYLGRDILSRVIAGSRVALIAGVEATLIALVLGVGIGMVIGLAGGWTDRVVMRVIDGVSAIPALVLAIAIIAALGTGLTRSMFAVGIAFAMSMARLARGLTLSERERLYVDGARVAGAGRGRLLRSHIAPNVAGPIAVQATLVFASAITIEAGLSFLGLGVQPPASSWGSMLANAQRTIREAPFQAIPPGVAIVLTVLSINVLGDAVVRRRRGESYDHPTGYLEPIAIEPSDRSDASADVMTGAATGDPDAPPTLLAASGVTVGYGSTTAVDRAGLAIGRGEVIALVGESGSGKTSLAMAIAGLLTPPAVATADGLRLLTSEGRVDLIGADAAGQRRWRSHVGVVFQEPSASLNPLQTVNRQLSDVIRAQRRVRRPVGELDIDAQVISLLTDVGLPRPEEVARLRPGQISGGMAQRVMIALALAKNPELLVADEPTTALDVTVQAEIIGLLRRLCRERHFGVLLVTHDLGVAGELADRCLVMFRGRIVETGPTQQVATDPKHPYTSTLVSAVPQNEPGRPILDAPALAADGGPSHGAVTPPDGRTAAPRAEVDIDVDIDVDRVLHGGCAYRLRCPHAIGVCADVEPENAAIGGDAERYRTVACHRAAELDLPGARPADAAPSGRATVEEPA
jgi:peptide/nickel transport system permease protein